MAINAQPAVLTIAGTDSSGGAGIQVSAPFNYLSTFAILIFILQADVKTFTAHRCYGTSVVVAMTAQNTTGVQAVHSTPPEFIEQQVGHMCRNVNPDIHHYSPVAFGVG